MYYPEIESADSEKQYLQNCIKMIIDNNKIPNGSAVVILTSREPYYYTIIGNIAYYHRVFYGIAYVSGGKRFRIVGKKQQDTQEYIYEVIDDSYSITYEDKVITSDINGFYHITSSDGIIVNAIPMSQIENHDVIFEIIRGANNLNYIRFKNPTTGEYYAGNKSCSARFYKLAYANL